jgi:hypothetical protein
MSRKTSLVSQYLENISRRALEKYQAIIRGYARRRPGVYALYRRGKLYYVGLASNLRSRLKMHLRDRHRDSWDRFSVYLTIGEAHLRELESLILRIVKPKGNKKAGKFRRSENLYRRFRRDLRQRFEEEIGMLVGDESEDELDRDTPLHLEGREPVLAQYIDRPLKLRGPHKGKVFRARVRRDGSIRFKGKRYTSPSVAAAVAAGRRSCNGYTFWQYERAPGDWVWLDELRK